MAEESKAPVAIRITRPYATESDFLEREFDTLTRTSVILIGAQSRPQGVVLRFEIVLKGGDSILRGEGRVVGYKDKAYGGEPGLSLRFTRLDARSKALVDRAVALREARSRGSLSPMPAAIVPEAVRSAPAVAPTGDRTSETARKPGPPPLAGLPTVIPGPPSSRRGPPPLPPAPPSEPLSSSDLEVESTQVDSTFHARVESRMGHVEAPPRPKTPTSTPPPLPTRARTRPPPPPASSSGVVERPRDREALLHRLRARGQALSPARVNEILSKRSAR